MSASTPKKPPTKRGMPAGPAVRAKPAPVSQLRAKPAPVSQLRAQTRRVLSKHYRSKYGVK